MQRQFDEQINKLKNKLLKMSSLVEEQLELSVKAIREEDETLARIVFEKEEKVDKYDFKVEKSCLKLFALNQPVALDLRLIMAAMNLSTDLERVGDLAVNICENFLKVKKKPSFYNKSKFEKMAEVAIGMLNDSIDSFIENDVQKAEDVIKRDRVLDNLNKENDDILIEVMKEDTSSIQEAVTFLEICHQLERCGDHATNVAEDVYFISEAHIVKHKYEKYIFTEYDKEINEDDINENDTTDSENLNS